MKNWLKNTYNGLKKTAYVSAAAAILAMGGNASTYQARADDDLEISAIGISGGLGKMNIKHLTNSQEGYDGLDSLWNNTPEPSGNQYLRPEARIDGQILSSDARPLGSSLRTVHITGIDKTGGSSAILNSTGPTNRFRANYLSSLPADYTSFAKSVQGAAYNASGQDEWRFTSIDNNGAFANLSYNGFSNLVNSNDLATVYISQIPTNTTDNVGNYVTNNVDLKGQYIFDGVEMIVNNTNLIGSFSLNPDKVTARYVVPAGQTADASTNYVDYTVQSTNGVYLASLRKSLNVIESASPVGAGALTLIGDRLNAQNFTFPVTNATGVSISSQPANGTINVHPATNGVFTGTFTPAVNPFGTFNVNYVGSNSVYSATNAIGVTTTNTAPASSGFVINVPTHVNGVGNANIIDPEADSGLEGIIVSGQGSFNGNTLTVTNDNTPNTKLVDFKVRDGHGATSAGTYTATVNFLNDAPTASGSSISINEDSGATNLTFNMNDANGHPVSRVIVSGPDSGLGSLVGNTFTPVANANGTTEIVWHANDGYANSPNVTNTVNISSVPDAPVGFPSYLTLNEDGFGFVTNNWTDVDSASASTVVYSFPTNGTLSATANPNAFRYQPNTNFNGIDSYTFKINDGGLESLLQTGTFTVNSVGDLMSEKNPGASYTSLIGKKKKVNLDARVLDSLMLNDADGISGHTYTASASSNPGFVISNTPPIFTIVSKGDTNYPNANFTINVNDNGQIIPVIVDLKTPLDTKKHTGIMLGRTSTNASNSGSVSLTAGTGNTASGKIIVAGWPYSFSGPFDAFGKMSATNNVMTNYFVPGHPASDMAPMYINLGFTDSTRNTITGNVQTATINSDFRTDALQWSTNNTAAAFTNDFKNFTLLTASDNPDTKGYTYGYGKLSHLGKSGMVIYSQDGQTLSSSRFINPEGESSFIISMYPKRLVYTKLKTGALTTNNSFKGEGMHIGRLNFDTNANTVTGWGVHQKPYWTNTTKPNPNPEGFTNDLTWSGSSFVPKPIGQRAINDSNINLIASGAGIDQNWLVNLATNNVGIPATTNGKLKFTLNGKTGLFSSSGDFDLNAGTKTDAAAGSILQNGPWTEVKDGQTNYIWGGGKFIRTNTITGNAESGEFRIDE